MDLPNNYTQVPTVNTTSSSMFNFNFKTIFLFIILICGCCLLSIGYQFDLDKFTNSNVGYSACLILVLFLFYVFYEFFKSDTCEDLKKSGWDRLKSSATRGTNYMSEQFSNGTNAFTNQMYPINQTQPQANF